MPEDRREEEVMLESALFRVQDGADPKEVAVDLLESIIKSAQGDDTDLYSPEVPYYEG